MRHAPYPCAASEALHLQQGHSAFILDVRIALSHFSVSSGINFRKSARWNGVTRVFVETALPKKRPTLVCGGWGASPSRMAIVVRQLLCRRAVRYERLNEL